MIKILIVLGLVIQFCKAQNYSIAIYYTDHKKHSGVALTERTIWWEKMLDTVYLTDNRRVADFLIHLDSLSPTTPLPRSEIAIILSNKHRVDTIYTDYDFKEWTINGKHYIDNSEYFLRNYSKTALPSPK